MSDSKDIAVKSKSWLNGSEASWRGPFNGLGELGGIFEMGKWEDGWQRNLRPNFYDHRRISIVYACVIAYARVVSTCPISHIRITGEGEYVEQSTSWVARLLRNPNAYETWSQLIFNIVSELGFHGASLCFFTRDNRNVPNSLHRVPYGNWHLFVEPETKEIFYTIHTQNGVAPDIPPDYLVPARDVIHFRQHCPRHPLLGESPVTAAALACGINVALSQSQVAFFNQMRRPSGVLTTDATMTGDQIKRLRAAFDEQSKRWDQGGIPILSNGLKFQSMSISSQDAQLIDAQKMSLDEVCRVYAVPPPVVGILEKSTFNNAETLINHWLSTGLGSLLENLEQSFAKAFGFSIEEVVNFETNNLLRSDAKSMLETLKIGITGGILSPNEARKKVKLKAVQGGDTVFLQQQNFPIDLLTDYAQSTVANQQRALAQPAAEASQQAEPEGDDDAEESTPKALPNSKTQFSGASAKNMVKKLMKEVA